MTRDYAKPFRSAEQKKGPRLRVFLFLALIIGMVGVGFWSWRQHKTKVPVSSPVTPAKVVPNPKTASPAPTLKPEISSNKLHFEFYTMLPKMQVTTNTSESTPPRAPTPVVSVSAPVVKTPAPTSIPSNGQYFVQLAVVRNLTAAEAYKAQLGDIGAPITFRKDMFNGQPVYRVQAGPFSEEASAVALQKKLEKSKISSLIRKVN